VARAFTARGVCEIKQSMKYASKTPIKTGRARQRENFEGRIGANIPSL
jgi:hypothetical protein